MSMLGGLVGFVPGECLIGRPGVVSQQVSRAYWPACAQLCPEVSMGAIAKL